MVILNCRHPWDDIELYHCIPLSFSSCFIGDTGVFFGAFLVPILLIVLFNSVVFVVVVTVLVKHLGRTAKGSTERKERIRGILRLVAIVGALIALFGLTWLFAALTASDGSTAFQVIFAIFNTTQGFFIFLLFCVVNSDARQLWKETFAQIVSKIRPGKVPPSQVKTTSVSQKRSTLPSTLKGQETSDTAALSDSNTLKQAGLSDSNTLKQPGMFDSDALEFRSRTDQFAEVEKGAHLGFENLTFYDRQLTPHGEHESEMFEIAL